MSVYDRWQYSIDEKKGGRFTLFDLASTNGTFVNDKECVKCSLKHNDLIRLGQVEMVFKRLDDGLNLAWWQSNINDEEE
jgi:pSer/pThr/pTyr-binding forkhead associated (FHA) protein